MCLVMNSLSISKESKCLGDMNMEVERSIVNRYVSKWLSFFESAQALWLVKVDEHSNII